MFNIPDSVKNKLYGLKKWLDLCNIKSILTDKKRKEASREATATKAPNVNLTLNRDPNNYWALVSVIDDGGFGKGLFLYPNY
jgi:hypothetical protein